MNSTQKLGTITLLVVIGAALCMPITPFLIIGIGLMILVYFKFLYDNRTKTIVIDNEQYKSFECIMLPANGPTQLSIGKGIKKMFFTPNGDIKALETLGNHQLENAEDFQHLYIISDEEIKEGDWHLHYYNGKPLIDQSFNGGVDAINSVRENFEYKKIIATTDPDLVYLIKETERGKIEQHLPKPTEEFLREFMERYNGGILDKEVLVEVKEKCGLKHGQFKQCDCSYQDIDCQYLIPIINTSPENTISIKFKSLPSKTELKDEHMVYMSDDMYIPIHYKGFVAKQPFFEGRGNHSVQQLEDICEKYKEYVHQQQVIKQNCMKHIIELKFGVEFPIE